MGKLSYEDKVNLYYDRKEGIPLSTISKRYSTTVDNIQFLERLIDKHGFEILNKRKSYKRYEKEQAINRVINGESIISVAIDEGIKSKSMLSHWVQKYKENGYNIVERERGRPAMKKESKKTVNKETIEEENKRLKEENLYLKAELEYSKKLRAVVQARKNQQQKKK